MPNTRKKRGRPSSREAMLNAAEAVVLEQGAGKLTLDAVARRAGVSKGGVIYNFPSKELLLEAMVLRLIEHSAGAHAAALKLLPEDRPGRSLKAYVQNAVRAPDTDDRVSSALLAVVANSPRLMARIGDYFRQRFKQLAQGVSLERAAIVHLATEGLWLLELIQASPLTRTQRARVAKALIRMADEGEEF